jgi:hypothetical protein
VQANLELQNLNKELLRRVAGFDAIEREYKEGAEQAAKSLEGEKAHSSQLLAALSAATAMSAQHDMEYTELFDRVKVLEKENADLRRSK